MPRSTLSVLLFLAGFTVFAQPGLCPCWLMVDVQKYHLHPFAHPERPHPHDYLFEIFNAESAAVAPPLPLPARTLILALALSGLWLWIGSHTASVANWMTPPPTPPPRLSASD